MRILTNFSCYSLRTKLVSIIMFSSTVCLLVSLSVLTVSSARSRYKDSLDQLFGLADVMAENGQAALVFSDRTEAQRLLKSLESHHEIASAWLINDKGVVLSSWSRKGAAEEMPADYSGQPMQLHSDFWSRYADLYRPVTRGTEQIGYVLLKADFTERWTRQIADLGEGLGAGALALLLVFLLSIRLQRVISSPLAEIADTARTIARDNAYSLRVPQQTTDEIGDLVKAFNHMLEEIQKRDEMLTRHGDHLEEVVSRRTEELRSLLENSPDTIVRYDLNGRRIYINPAFQAMTKEGNDTILLGKKPSESPGGPNYTVYEAQLKNVSVTGKNAQFEFKFTDHDGKEVCHHIRLMAERNLAGTVTSVLGVGRDITELKTYQAELQRKELAKSRFLAAAGHDMRQPLAAANLFIDALKFTAPTADQNQIIQRLEQAMSNFNNLLDALLNVSKLDAGMIKPEYTSINVTELFIWLEQNLAPLANEKQLRFEFYLPERKALFIRSDIGLIQSVLMNLISNAIKFTQKGGILVSARQRENKVLFQVWDTGLGIKNEYYEKIFDEFFQVNNQQRDRTRGLGLGLSIVKRALLLLGQEITCRSEIGRGSMFGFRLPLDTESSDALPQVVAETQQEDIDQSAFVQGKCFVVVEDDALVAEALSKTLTGMGGKVRLFHRAEIALNQIDIEDTDYFIVDFILGGTLNGIQFLNQFSQKLGKPVIGVIMTGDTSPTFVREAANCAWPVLHKPVSISKVITSIRTQVVDGV